MTERIAFFGLGNMGAPMAPRSAGLDVVESALDGSASVPGCLGERA